MVVLTTLAHAQVRVLLVEGASNHDWERRIDILESIVSRAGGLTMDVTVAPAVEADPAWATWAPNFSDYDVVVTGYRGDNGAPDWPQPIKNSLQSFVSGGGGLMVFHEALQGFPNWIEYQTMIGLSTEFGGPGQAIEVAANESLILHPSNQGATAHGAQADSLVTRIADNHPIYAGLPDSWMAANLEVTRYPRGPAASLSNPTILSYATDPDPPAGQTAKQWPIEWTVNYGSGRVYASTYGHIFDFETAPTGMRCAAFQEIFVRAIRWLAGVNPPATVPVDFPGTQSVSLRPYSEGFAAFGGASAVGPYSNGVLPNSSIVPTGFEIVPAFQNLSWDSPIDARPWPGSATDLLIVEMDGRFYRVVDDDAAAERTLVLDMQNQAWYMNWDEGSEPPLILGHKHGGVMSCAFHPEFGTGAGKDELYVYYLNHATDNPSDEPPYFQRVSKFVWNGTSFGGEQVLIQQYDTVKGHDGGSLAFGPDGFLYITFGDEGTASQDAAAHVQKINDRPRSGVWRIDVDQQGGAISHPIRRQPLRANPTHNSFTQNYYIPSDNPWVDETYVQGVDPEADALEEFYAIGLREPHRMSFDPVGGRFWIGDVGANTIEEVNVLDAPGGTQGLNFQWRYKEGSGDGFGSVPSPLIGSERGPVHEYDRSVGNCIIGGFVYHGAAMPDLQGKYLFGDNGTQNVYALEFQDAGGVVTKVGVESVGIARVGGIWRGIGSFGEAQGGEPLVLQMGGGKAGEGLISRIQPAGTSSTLEWEYPPLLSETGLFSDLASLTPVLSMIPYEVNAPLWSAGVAKRRWVMIPNDGVPSEASERIIYSENQPWQFPVGTVFVKHFARPDNDKPLETRLMVNGVDGWGGVTYRWRANGLEADLLEEGGVETMTIDGETFDYLYPARAQCFLCHTEGAGPVLGFRTRQLNATVTYPSGGTGNQIEALSAAGFIEQIIKAEDLTGTITSAGLDDTSSSLEHRVRSYLDSNCSHCHQPSGSSRAFFDARLTTPIENQGLICGPVIESLGLSAPAVVKPGSLDNSVLFQRMHSIQPSISMPPVAKGRIDQEAVVEMAAWILGMTPDSCTSAQSFFGGGDLGVVGAPGTSGGTGVDPWVVNLVVDKSSAFTNNTSGPVTVALDRFRFRASRVGDPVTPFVVKLNGGNNFTVLAIGTTRSAYAIGLNDVAFSMEGSQVVLQAGESMAAGFLDANANGSGGTGPEVIMWTAGGSEVWHGGGLAEADAGSLTVGLAPQPGTNVLVQNRDYRFATSYTIAGDGGGGNLGNSLILNGLNQVDSAQSNFVIDLSDTYTNVTGSTVSVSFDRFRFKTTRVTDPLTPFVVRINGPDDFTVLAVGTSRTSYLVGENDVAFGGGGGAVTVEPGETVAAGFVDSLPNGTGGSGPGAVVFIDGPNAPGGGDTNFYRYHSPAEVGATLLAGQPPVIPHPYGGVGPRSYLFEVSMIFETGGDLGGPLDDPSGDEWTSNLVINQDSVYVNNTGLPVSVALDRFQFHAVAVGDPVTPLAVRVNGANDFTVLAVGTTRNSYAAGFNDFAFSDSGSLVVLKPGQKLAVGFLDSNADGSGGSGAAVIPWTAGGDQIWHGGGPNEVDSGSVTVGAAPVPGTNVVVRNRDYYFTVSYLIGSMKLGNSMDLEGFRQVDGAASNFAINLTDAFTNNTGGTLTVSVDRFQFVASRVTDPLTPFVVRVNGANNFTVIAIGTPRTSYLVGDNDVPFSSATTLISIADGETIAPGFVDSLPDGTGGSGPGAITFIDASDAEDGGDTNYYRYQDPQHVGAILELGSAPVVPHLYGGVLSPVGSRSYLFGVQLGFGGKEDEDGDGLRDSWELAFAPNLATLGAGDRDGDGLSDADELDAGTDPTDQDSRFEVLEVRPAPGGVTVDFRSVPGRTYGVQWSSTLGGWTVAGTVEAADWPSMTTEAIIPASSLPNPLPKRLFVRLLTQ